MLRKGIVALMIGVMSVGSMQAEDDSTPSRLMEFLRGPAIGRPHHRSADSPTTSSAAGVTHAVVADAEKQVPEIRQTSNGPTEPRLVPAEHPPQPMPAQYAPAAQSEGFSGNTAGQVAAGGGYQARAYYPTGRPQFAQPPHGGAAFRQVAATGYRTAQMYPQVAAQPYQGMSGNGMNMHQGGALYPAPLPGIPQQVGGSAIVTPAFHPSEMMHAHRNTAMYGPYYYKVDGCWVVTPFGVWSNENWKLRGTTVDVKYKSHISPWAMFKRPVVH